MRLMDTDVLLVIDVQNDFLPGGALAVPNGDAVIAPINRLADIARHCVVTQDWHPASHVSFASQHPGKTPFETVVMPYGRQVLWPDHCVQGSAGADLASGLDLPKAELVLRKGCHREIDSYSAFLEADRTTPTGFTGYLRERGVDRLFVTGLATDFCILWTALDARAAGFMVAVIEDAVRGIDIDGSVANAWKIMAQASIERIASNSLLSEPV